MTKRTKTLTERDPIDRFLEGILPRFPTLDPSTEAAVDRMTRIVKHLDKVSGRTTGRYDLNVGEFKVLLNVDHGPESAGSLAECLSLSSGAMTNRLDGLEEAGYIQRVRDPEDRRSVLVAITDEGRDILTKAVAAQAEEETSLLSILSPVEQDQLNELLRRLVLAIEAQAGG